MAVAQLLHLSGPYHDSFSYRVAKDVHSHMAFVRACFIYDRYPQEQWLLDHASSNKQP